MTTIPKTETFLARQLRKARGNLSQEDLAFKVREVSGGKHTPAATDLSRYERSVHAPRMAMLAAIAKATGKDIEFFLNESEEADDDEEAALRTLAVEALGLGRYDMADGLLALARLAAARKSPGFEALACRCTFRTWPEVAWLVLFGAASWSGANAPIVIRSTFAGIAAAESKVTTKTITNR